MHRLLYLADVALAHASVEHEAGETQRHGFVVNMAWLFETLVARLLSDQQIRVGEQETFPLDTLDRLAIRPDLVFYGPNGVTGVADTKCHVGITPTRRAGADDRARPSSARLSTTQKVNVRGCHDEDIGTLDAAPHTGECRKPILSAVGKRACAARRC